MYIPLWLLVGGLLAVFAIVIWVVVAMSNQHDNEISELEERIEELEEEIKRVNHPSRDEY